MIINSNSASSKSLAIANTNDNKEYGQEDVVSIGEESGVIGDIKKHIKEYFQRISENITDNGIGGTFMSGVGEGFILGAFVGLFVPPVVTENIWYIPAVGATVGFLHGIAAQSHMPSTYASFLFGQGVKKLNHQ